MLKKALFALLMSAATVASALPFSSRHALVYDEQSGEILLEKNADVIVPIASLTKLMTAMVVLDAGLDLDQRITIDESDVDTLKFSSSRVPVGVTLSRRELLELALMSSDNRAAAALGRTYPGGHRAFAAAAERKALQLGMFDTYIEEPTGLSPNNRSSAHDLRKMVSAAARYAEISRMSTGTGELMEMNGRMVQYRNTNRLVGSDGWNILLSKTGFTREAGRCLVMRFETAGRNVIVVLLNANETAARVMDAENVQRFLTGETLVSAHVPRALPAAKTTKSKLVRTKAKTPAKQVSSRKRPNT